MTMMQYLSTFRLYSAEVLLLAFGVTLVTSLLKKTVLKNVQSKVYVLLPFALGLAFYAVYRTIVTASLIPLSSEIGATFEGGFACGCAATLYYVIWEQFFRGNGESVSPLYPLLAGFVEETRRAEAANALYDGGSELDGEELNSFIAEVLREYVAETVTDGEFAALCKLIEEYLLAVRNA